mmetsp:Transcript_21762/g.47349  ORF Transcript_21762/g.47349 Transcript_21762/m.47349 type:complete len:617 (-) Transcript_21762:412-2262(-)
MNSPHPWLLLLLLLLPTVSTSTQGNDRGRQGVGIGVGGSNASATATTTSPIPIRIMPLGDSITLGYYAAGGYRGHLFANLTSLGYAVDFVGSEDSNPISPATNTTSFDPNHEGHSEWTIDQIASNIELWLDFVVHPDIILLHIGTNDFGKQVFDTRGGTAIDRLERLVHRICTLRPRAHVIVTNLLKREEPFNEQIEATFNPYVEERVANQASLGHRVSYLDMRSRVPLEDLPDKLHPNAAGYKKMSQAWSESIIALVGPPGDDGMRSFVTVDTKTSTTMTTAKPTTEIATARLLPLLLAGGVLLGVWCAAGLLPKKRKILILLLAVLTIFVNANVEPKPFLSLPYDVSLSTMTTNSTLNDDGNNFLTWLEQEHKKRQTKIARSKEIIPKWMSDYLVWHREQREKLRNNNTGGEDDNNIKYLVVRCLQGDGCGRLSNRMKPMPFYLMVANVTNRVLLIHWEKPSCGLEHFVTPPPNGLDWRIEGTTVTVEDVRNNSNFHNGGARPASLSAEIRKLAGVMAGYENTLVRAKVLSMLLKSDQLSVEARSLFNEWRKEPDQYPAWGDAYLGWNVNATEEVVHDLFEDVFRVLFEPSPELCKATYFPHADFRSFSTWDAW